jgi:hypothetical protein
VTGVRSKVIVLVVFRTKVGTETTGTSLTTLAPSLLRGEGAPLPLPLIAVDLIWIKSPPARFQGSYFNVSIGTKQADSAF